MDDNEITTVGDLVAALLKFDQAETVKICTEFPYHKYVSVVEMPAPNITDRCVGIYADI